MKKPTIALVLGDPAGIGPELVAKMLNKAENRALANILIIADEVELQKGISIAQCGFDYQRVDDFKEGIFVNSIPALIHHPNRSKLPFEYGKATAQSGAYMLETLKIAVDLALAGHAQAICFAPLNKQAMHMGGLEFRDELHWFAQQTSYTGFGCEINIVGDIWAGRVTSHIPFKDIVPSLSIDGIVQTIELMHNTLKKVGFETPRIAVQALNPHGGENGIFGDEEITLIKPAMEIARKKGIVVYGPYATDTTIMSMRKEQEPPQAIVSMYHDQASTALKLLGFESGITVQGGIPIPIATANHGTAYDLYGKNIATPQALEAAFHLTVKMGISSLAN